MASVQELLNRSAFSAFQKSVFAMCFLIVLCDGFDTAAIGYVAPALLAEWGVTKPQLGPVLSAALFGLAAGALGSGPLADRFGRKRVLVASVFVFALGSLACAQASGLDALVIWRFVTGVGLGAAMPNAVTLTSEYSPDRGRAFITNAMFCGFPLGAALGGFLAAWLIPGFGWRSVFVVGGVAPLMLAVLLVFLLPESIRHMLARRADPARIRAVMRRIAPEAATIDSFTLPEAASSQGEGAQVVLSRELRLGTFMLWIAYFMGLVIFYALINWLPLLLKEAQIAPRAATLITSLFALGGFGALASGWLMDRRDADWTVAAFYALTALSVAAIGLFLGSPAALVAIVFLAGVAMNTAQTSLPSLAAAYYPTRGRGTGVAWMLGVGRFGGIAGSFLVGWLTQMQLSLPAIFAVVSIAGLVAAAALAVKRLARRA
jgi:AAHS family 4-hydroxybenzoate transporter-like MFS transporter